MSRLNSSSDDKQIQTEMLILVRHWTRDGNMQTQQIIKGSVLCFAEITGNGCRIKGTAVADKPLNATQAPCFWCGTQTQCSGGFARSRVSCEGLWGRACYLRLIAGYNKTSMCLVATALWSCHTHTRKRNRKIKVDRNFIIYSKLVTCFNRPPHPKTHVFFQTQIQQKL